MCERTKFRPNGKTIVVAGEKQSEAYSIAILKAEKLAVAVTKTKETEKSTNSVGSLSVSAAK